MMVTLPPEMPVTIPVVLLMEAIEALLLVHVPPATELDIVVVAP